MKILRYLALVSAIAMLPFSVFAKNTNEHSIDISNQVKVGRTQLQPGSYKVEWQGAGPAVNVQFVEHGETVATAPATLKTNDKLAFQDDIVTDSTKTNVRALREIDFGHNKEALVFRQKAM